MTDLFGAISLFVRVARTGSFSHAAREQGLSQPTVSRAIASLEKEIGVALFTRTPRAVVLTEAGRDYYGRVETILGALDEATHAVRGTGELRGSLRLGLSSSFALREVIPRLPAFLGDHPELHTVLLIDDGRQNLVAEGIDVAFRFGDLPDSTAVARRICALPRVAVAAPDYLARMGVPQTPADLASHSVIAGPATSNTSLAFQQDGRIATVKMDGRITVTLNEALIVAAVQGLGIALTTLGSCIPELASGDLVPVLPAWQLEDIEIHAVYPGGRAAKPAARALVDFIVAEMSGHDPYPLPFESGATLTKEGLAAAQQRLRAGRPPRRK